MFSYEVEYIIDNELKTDIVTLDSFYSDFISDFISDKVKQVEGSGNFEILNYKEIERISI